MLRRMREEEVSENMIGNRERGALLLTVNDANLWLWTPMLSPQIIYVYDVLYVFNSEK